MSPAEWLQVGYVARAHGLRGEVGVKPFDPDSQVLLDVGRLQLELKSGQTCLMSIRSARPAVREILIHLQGISDRTAAEALVGAAVRVHREELPAPEEGEYFQGDLVGLEAFDAQGVKLGEVVEVWETGPVPNLVIRGPGLAMPELVVPFVEEFVPKVDLERRRLTVNPPEYWE